LGNRSLWCVVAINVPLNQVPDAYRKLLTSRKGLQDPLFVLDFAGGEGDEAYLCLGTGRLYFYSDYANNEERLPDDIADIEKFVCLPDKRELELGKPLALLFAAESLSADCERVKETFGRPGAYAAFKELLDHRGFAATMAGV
jgi:hypothetical protein